MQCCRCREEMLLVEYEQIELDYCPDCGIWLDAGELELILAEPAKPGADEAGADEAGALEAAPSDDDAPVACPVCRARMQKGRYDRASTSVIDRCPRGHGIWLDRGELREIVSAHAASASGEGSAVTSFLVNLFGEEG